MTGIMPKLNSIPDHLLKYSETSLFNEETLPAALKANHATKPGVWAKAIVHEGAIEYLIAGSPDEPLLVEAGSFALIEPEVIHHVRLLGKVSFQLHFYRDPEATKSGD